CGILSNSRLWPYRRGLERMSNPEIESTKWGEVCNELVSERDKLRIQIADLATQLSVAEKKLNARTYLLKCLHRSYVYRLMRTFGLWGWLTFDETVVPLDRKDPAIKRSTDRRVLKRVVVDLLPLLPGGENGGAKIVAIELVRL